MKLLRKIIIFLVLRIDWRKLLLIELPLLYISMNSNVHLNEKNSLTRLEQFETHAVVSMNTSTVLNPLVSTNTSTVLNHVVSTNTSTVLNQSKSIVEERPISSRKRGQSSKRKRRHRKAEDIVAPPPPLRPVPHCLLRYVRSLTPYEALVYAKKEMENISSVINDPDPELYAPLFRNVSVFQRLLDEAQHGEEKEKKRRNIQEKKKKKQYIIVETKRKINLSLISNFISGDPRSDSLRDDFPNDKKVIISPWKEPVP